MPNPLETVQRQQKFLKIYKETKDPTLASGEAWPELPPRRRATAARRALTQPEVRLLLSKYDLSLPKVMKRHEALMTTGKEETQARMVELGYKLHGVMKVTDTPDAPTVQVNIDPGRLAAVAERLEAINKKMLPQYSDVIDVE